jgi:hypothetical protein
MSDITHIILLIEQTHFSLRLIEFDGDFSPTTRQVREEFGLSEDAQFKILDIRRAEVKWISATGKPDGLQHCSLRDLGAQLDMWTNDLFSPISHVSISLLEGTIPLPCIVECAVEELRLIEADPGEVLEEEAEFAHELAAELERRLSKP